MSSQDIGTLSPEGYSSPLTEPLIITNDLRILSISTSIAKFSTFLVFAPLDIENGKQKSIAGSLAPFCS
jgi:hypothetical protein